MFVATDNSEIAKLSEKCGVRAVVTSVHCQTGSDRIFETLNILKNENKIFDVVLNIQGDEPLINHTLIDPLADAFLQNTHLDMATLSHPLSVDDVENKNAVKVLLNKNSEAIYFSRFGIPFSRVKFEKNKYDECVQKHIGLYGFTTAFLKKLCEEPQTAIEKSESLEQLRALHLGAKIKVISVPQAIQGIDTPEDLIQFEKLYNKGLSK